MSAWTSERAGESEWGGGCHRGCEDICHYPPKTVLKLNDEKEPSFDTFKGNPLNMQVNGGTVDIFIILVFF